MTPGVARAARSSTRPMRPPTRGAWLTTPKSMPGSTVSMAKRASPVTLAGTSSRGSERPSRRKLAGLFRATLPGGLRTAAASASSP